MPRHGLGVAARKRAKKSARMMVLPFPKAQMNSSLLPLHSNAPLPEEEQIKQKHIYKLEDFGLPPDIAMKLNRAGFRVVGDLDAASKSCILETRGIGPASFMKINRALVNSGLTAKA